MLTIQSSDSKTKILSLTKKRREIKLTEKEISVDEALLLTFIKGLELICDQGRYSNVRFKKYIQKWTI